MDPIFEHETRRAIDPPPPEPGIVDAARTSRDAAVLLAHSVADGGRVTARVVRAQLEQSPYLTLAVVAGCGFVVAGGLTTPAVRSLANVGTRFAIAAASRKLTEILVGSLAAERPPET